MSLLASILRHLGLARSQPRREGQAFPISAPLDVSLTMAEARVIRDAADDTKLDPEAVSASKEVRHFSYMDARGRIASRSIVNWVETPTHLIGYDLDRHAERTFRLDRLLEGEAPAPADAVASPRKRPAEPRVQPAQSGLTILFTGFDSDTRTVLEETAATAGFIVRANMSKYLAFLCGGPNAGPSKVRQAKSQGTVVLTEDEFKVMAETGELPD